MFLGSDNGHVIVQTSFGSLVMVMTIVIQE